MSFLYMCNGFSGWAVGFGILHLHPLLQLHPVYDAEEV